MVLLSIEKRCINMKSFKRQTKSTNLIRNHFAHYAGLIVIFIHSTPYYQHIAPNLTQHPDPYSTHHTSPSSPSRPSQAPAAHTPPPAPGSHCGSPRQSSHLPSRPPAGTAHSAPQRSSTSPAQATRARHAQTAASPSRCRRAICRPRWTSGRRPWVRMQVFPRAHDESPWCAACAYAQVPGPTRSCVVRC